MLIGTLAGWNLLLDWLDVHIAFVACLTEAPPALLVRNGRMLTPNLWRQRVSREDVEVGLCRCGHETSDHVKAMYRKGDGTFSIIARKR